jgi:hypothetical protein
MVALNTPFQAKLLDGGLKFPFFTCGVSDCVRIFVSLSGITLSVSYDVHFYFFTKYEHFYDFLTNFLTNFISISSISLSKWWYGALDKCSGFLWPEENFSLTICRKNYKPGITFSSNQDKILKNPITVSDSEPKITTGP